MKALSFKQPWAWLVFHGKDIDNRKRSTKYRGFILVHASNNYDEEGALWVSKNFPDIKIPPTLIQGAILGRVEIFDCVNNSSSPWFFGPYGFVLTNPEEFKKPIPCKGKLGFFEVEI